jgi:hypothetical protein
LSDRFVGETGILQAISNLLYFSVGQPALTFLDDSQRKQFAASVYPFLTKSIKALISEVVNKIPNEKTVSFDCATSQMFLCALVGRMQGKAGPLVS